MAQDCILALDLGTTAFKAAPVDEDGVSRKVTTVRYALDYADGGVTCDPDRYVGCAVKALRGAARTAQEAGRRVLAIGLSSQAQTFIPIDHEGKPVHPAVVWTDARATPEAEEAARALPDFAATAGFCAPSPLQFLPKVMRFRRQEKEAARKAARFLLLNEWIAFRLTGEAYGDETNQGMGGFYDVQRRQWSQRALDPAGITETHLAQVAPAAGYAARLTQEAGRALGLSGLPVYSCGNDQSCAAIGAGLEGEGDVFCNFGTALVVYALMNRYTEPASPDQIAGISPLPGLFFLLGLESECGNVLDWLAALFTPRGGVARLIDAALHPDLSGRPAPTITLPGSGKIDLQGLCVGSRREEIARAFLEFYSARFGALLKSVMGEVKPAGSVRVGGGLSTSAVWLDFLARKQDLTFAPTLCKHPGLAGIARIIRRNAGGL